MSVVICVIGFFAAVVVMCCVFKYALKEVTVGTLIVNMLISSLAFLGLTARCLKEAVLVASIPTFAAGIALLVCVLADHDKRLF